MKVRLEDGYKDRYTLSDLERARAVIAYEKEDEETVKGWAEYAVSEALKGIGDYGRDILKAEARTAKNCRVWDAYGDGTGDMDVWITAIAETELGFLTVGAYLSDIWQTGAVNYREFMWVHYYTEA